jgi:hypothetical protein
MTLYHTPEEVNNLYSDNPPVGPPPYPGPTAGRDTMEMEDQAHGQSLNRETQECEYDITSWNTWKIHPLTSTVGSFVVHPRPEDGQ